MVPLLRAHRPCESTGERSPNCSSHPRSVPPAAAYAQLPRGIGREPAAGRGRPVRGGPLPPGYGARPQGALLAFVPSLWGLCTCSDPSPARLSRPPRLYFLSGGCLVSLAWHPSGFAAPLDVLSRRGSWAGRTPTLAGSRPSRAPPPCFAHHSRPRGRRGYASRGRRPRCRPLFSMLPARGDSGGRWPRPAPAAEADDVWPVVAVVTGFPWPSSPSRWRRLRRRPRISAVVVPLGRSGSLHVCAHRPGDLAPCSICPRRLVCPALSSVPASVRCAVARRDLFDSTCPSARATLHVLFRRCAARPVPPVVASR